MYNSCVCHKGLVYQMPKYGLLCIWYYIQLIFATLSQPSVKPLLNFPYDDNEFITINKRSNKLQAPTPSKRGHHLY